MLVVHGPHELRGGVGQLLLMLRRLAPVQLEGEGPQEIGHFRPGFRVQMLRVAESAGEFLDVVHGRSSGSVGLRWLILHGSVSLGS